LDLEEAEAASLLTLALTSSMKVDQHGESALRKLAAFCVDSRWIGSERSDEDG
jgi:hypothetical protein